MTTNNSDRNSPGFWLNLLNSFRVAWKLLWDRQVPLSTKLIPLLVGLYIVAPIDILHFIPGLGQLDDLAVLIIGVKVFIALSPKDVVARVRAEINGDPPPDDWTVTGSQPHGSDQNRSSASKDIIDG